MNDHRQVVGASQVPDGSWHAYVWQRGTMTDLGAGVAFGINERGGIVGEDAFGGHAVQWRGGQRTAVPQPVSTFSSWARPRSGARHTR
jgi:probable HAF family extracellular repeat protein